MSASSKVPVVLSELMTVVLPSMVHWYTSGVSPVALQVRMTLSPVTAGSTPSILTSGSSERLKEAFYTQKRIVGDCFESKSGSVNLLGLFF